MSNFAYNLLTNALGALTLVIGQALAYFVPDPRFSTQITAISGSIAFILWTLGKDFLIKSVPSPVYSPVDMSREDSNYDEKGA